MKRNYEQEIQEAISRSSIRLDAGETAFVTRELLAIKQETYETKYPLLRALEFVPLAQGIDPWAEAIAWQLTDRYGKAKLVANDAKDLPRINVQIGEASTPIRTLGAEQVYSYIDLQRSLSGRRLPLTRRIAEAARKTMAEAVEYAVAFGDSQTGMVGLTNAPNVTITAAAAAWSAATPQQMYADLVNAAGRITNNTKGAQGATTVLLPPSAMVYGTSVAWSATGASDLTVLKFFQGNHPGINVEPWYQLETAGAGGTRRAIVYERSPDVVEAIVPLPYYEFAPQADRLAIIIPCIARIGGVQVRYPKAIEYIDGV